MVRASDLEAILRRSGKPLPTGSLAHVADAPWQAVADLLAVMEARGEVFWLDQGWVLASRLGPAR